jgi:hypothetical protein
VRVLFRGAYETFIAYADRPLGRGEGALISAVRHGGAVDVLPWAAPTASDQPFTLSNQEH